MLPSSCSRRVGDVGREVVEAVEGLRCRTIVLNVQAYASYFLLVEERVFGGVLYSAWLEMYKV